MYDLHSHILPGVDDGARDLETALEMARLAVDKGITTLAATPHWDLVFDWKLIKQRVEELAVCFQQENISLKLVPGAELFMDYNLVNLSKEQIPTYNNNGQYCLLEFPMFEIPNYSDDVIFSLKVKGITPIIAHPERYKNVAEDPNLIKRWIDNGCLMQMNAGSVTGMFGERIQKISEILLEHQMVHIMASDAHSTGRRGFVLQEGADRVEALIGVEQKDLLVVGNPGAVVAGEQLEVPEALSYKPRKRFWFF